MKHRVYSVSMASVYPHNVAKAEEGTHESRGDRIVCWLTGYSEEGLDDQLANNVNFEDFFGQAPRLNPSRSLVTGAICGPALKRSRSPSCGKFATWTK